MQYLYAPWRDKYFDSDKSICPFCEYKNKSDDELGIIFRAKYSYVIMNAYPYSGGHFMVIPYEHIENLEDLDNETWKEICDLVKIGVKILKEKLNAQGVNIGMNLGDMAGAGIAKHCHYHLVPRWFKDTNFITTIANTRVCGSDLEKIRQILKKAYEEYLC